MSARVYGSKYDKDLDVAEIAKRVRAEIKAAVEIAHRHAVVLPRGELPEGALPLGNYSVKIRRYAGGQSVDVRFAWSGAEALFSAPRLRFEAEYPHVYPGNSADPEVRVYYSAYAREVTSRLEAILAAYNHDGSDSMTDYYDVKFSAHVSPDHDWERERRAIETEAATRVELPAMSAFDERCEAEERAARNPAYAGDVAAAYADVVRSRRAMPENDADAVVAIVLAEDVERETSAQEKFLSTLGIES